MIPRRFSRFQVAIAIIMTAFFTYSFHSDIKTTGIWVDQTVIQPHAQLWNYLIWGLAISGIIGFVGLGIYITGGDWIRKNGTKLFNWAILLYDIFAGIWFILFGTWYFGILMWAISFLPWWILTDEALKERQKGA